MATKYLAFPESFYGWLIKSSSAIELLSRAVLEASQAELLRQSVHAVDTFRATRSSDGQLLIIWNADYLDSTGGQGWAFVSLDEDCGLLRYPDIASDTAERAIKVAGARLTKSTLPAHYRLRRYEDNFKTCTAGGPSIASHQSLAFWEGEVVIGASRRFCVLVVGPDDGPSGSSITKAQEKVIDFCRHRKAEAATLIALADATLTKSTLKSACALETFSPFEKIIAPRTRPSLPSPNPIEPVPALNPVGDESSYVAQSLTYDQWAQASSPLTPEQRLILESDVITRQPIRINGPAGSGKTLLMQLLCMRQLRRADAGGNDKCRCLYICHNASMKDALGLRFETLGAGDYMFSEPARLQVETLSEYCSTQLQLSPTDVVDSDAAETKAFQSELVAEAIKRKLSAVEWSKVEMPLIKNVMDRPGLMGIFVELVVHEIGISIKGHSLTHNKARYIDSEVPFSRLHGNLFPAERRFVYEVFEEYYRQTTEEENLLDADDLAISLLAKLHTPLWNIRRKNEGVDFLFVDETQLFNENERRIFAYLTKVPPNSTHLPIALALDEAQELKGSVSSGFGALGIESIVNEHLENVYRCTPSILKLAFFVIQQTTDLFGVEFPNFTEVAKSLVPDNHSLARPPTLRVGGSSGSLGNFIAKRAKALRSSNLRSVCIVVHADKYWEDAKAAVKRVTGAEPYVLRRRGDVFGVARPGIVLARPEFVGGQEFDAVISVGLEDGIVPPKVEPESFAESLRQRALREMYLVFTRARFRLEIIVSINSALSSILQPTLKNGLLVSAGE